MCVCRRVAWGMRFGENRIVAGRLNQEPESVCRRGLFRWQLHEGLGAARVSESLRARGVSPAVDGQGKLNAEYRRSGKRHGGLRRGAAAEVGGHPSYPL